MTNNKKLSATIFTIILALTLISPVQAKRNNTNKQSNATLEETQRFIRQKINAIPEIPKTRDRSMIIKSQEWAFNGCDVEFTSVRKLTQKSKFTLSDMRLPLELKDSHAQLPVLEMRTIGDKENVTFGYVYNQSTTGYVYKQPWELIYFEDREIAERVVKALTHAIKLCSGKYEPEPF